MGSEAVIIKLLGNGGDVLSATCADATAIAKGTLLYYSDPVTVAPHSAADQSFAGIAAMEKVANDGSTRISYYTNGIFDLKDSGAGITAGARCAVSGTANQIIAADANDILQSSDVGVCLETASAAEVIAVKVLK